jgi:hypothetical protein
MYVHVNYKLACYLLALESSLVASFKYACVLLEICWDPAHRIMIPLEALSVSLYPGLVFLQNGPVFSR